jgi:hypothetical protein
LRIRAVVETATCVRGYEHIEIGDQETFGFVARALDYSGRIFEDDRPDTLAEAMAALGKGSTIASGPWEGVAANRWTYRMGAPMGANSLLPAPRA